MAITSFTGVHAFLSNFAPCTLVITSNGVKQAYPTIEHAYQAWKTRDTNQRAQIAACATPGKAKRQGKTVTVRTNWNEIKLDVMRWLLNEKFKDPTYRQLLLGTGEEELIEGNTWGDTYWGICGNVGANHLGKILMQVRDGIRGELGIQ